MDPFRFGKILVAETEAPRGMRVPWARLIFSFLFLVFAVGLFWSTRKPSLTPVASVSLNLFNPEEIDQIILAHKADQNFEKWVFKKTGSQWLLETEYPRPASTARLKDILQTFSHLKGEIRAQKPSVWSTFYLEEDQALHLIFKSQGQLKAHFLLGKQGPWPESSFFRLASSKTVYLASKNLLWLFKIFSKEPRWPSKEVFLQLFTDWQVLNLDPSQVKLLHFHWPSGEWRLDVVSGRWQINGQPHTFPVEETQSFLKKLFPLLASEILDPQKGSRLSWKGLFEVQTKEGPPLRIDLGTDPQGQIYARRGPFYYRLTDPSWEALLWPLKASLPHQSSH